MKKTTMQNKIVTVLSVFLFLAGQAIFMPQSAFAHRPSLGERPGGEGWVAECDGKDIKKDGTSWGGKYKDKHNSHWSQSPLSEVDHKRSHADVENEYPEKVREAQEEFHKKREGARETRGTQVDAAKEARCDRRDSDDGCKEEYPTEVQNAQNEFQKTRKEALEERKDTLDDVKDKDDPAKKDDDDSVDKKPKDKPTINSIEDMIEIMRKVAIGKLGQPIEGFTPRDYMTVFPALEKADFEGVRAEQGVYQLEEGELVFILDDPEAPIHSAHDMITDEGLMTLVRNVAIRLGMDLETPGAFNEILEKIRGESEPESDLETNPDVEMTLTINEGDEQTSDREVTLTLSHLGGNVPAPTGPVAERAYEYDQSLNLTLWNGEDDFNWGGLEEKWLRTEGAKADREGWYYITPDGKLYHWLGLENPPQVEQELDVMNRELVAELSPAYWEDLSLLYNAADPSGNTGGVESDIVSARYSINGVDYGELPGFAAGQMNQNIQIMLPEEDGEYTVEVTLVDNQGNKSVLTESITLNTSAVDPETTEPEPETPELTLIEQIQSLIELLEGEVIGELGHPSEGFTPDLFLEIFPMLKETDFDGVEAQQGVYRMEEGDLVFDQYDLEEPMHSAGQSITAEGMETLVIRLADRLIGALEEMDDIEAIFKLLLGEEFEVVPPPIETEEEIERRARDIIAGHLGIEEADIVGIIVTKYEGAPYGNFPLYDVRVTTMDGKLYEGQLSGIFDDQMLPVFDTVHLKEIENPNPPDDFEEEAERIVKRAIAEDLGIEEAALAEVALSPCEDGGVPMAGHYCQVVRVRTTDNKVYEGRIEGGYGAYMLPVNLEVHLEEVVDPDPPDDFEEEAERIVKRAIAKHLGIEEAALAEVALSPCENGDGPAMVGHYCQLVSVRTTNDKVYEGRIEGGYGAYMLPVNLEVHLEEVVPDEFWEKVERRARVFIAAHLGIETGELAEFHLTSRPERLLGGYFMYVEVTTADGKRYQGPLDGSFEGGTMLPIFFRVDLEEITDPGPIDLDLDEETARHRIAETLADLFPENTIESSDITVVAIRDEGPGVAAVTFLYEGIEFHSEFEQISWYMQGGTSGRSGSEWVVRNFEGEMTLTVLGKEKTLRVTQEGASIIDPVTSSEDLYEYFVLVRWSSMLNCGSGAVGANCIPTTPEGTEYIGSYDFPGAGEFYEFRVYGKPIGREPRSSWTPTHPTYPSPLDSTIRHLMIDGLAAIFPQDTIESSDLTHLGIQSGTHGIATGNITYKGTMYRFQFKYYSVIEAEGGTPTGGYDDWVLTDLIEDSVWRAQGMTFDGE